jgi:hypothetical protein
VGSPRLFKTGAVLMIWGYGLLLVIPILVSFVALTVVRLGLWTLLIPLSTLVATAWLVPLGQGNSYIAQRLKALRPGASVGDSDSEFLVQLSLTPRIRRGVRASLEDADDFGFLSFKPDRIDFEGDSIRLSVPYENIKNVSEENVGMRGRFVCGARITVEVDGLRGAGFLQVAERSSLLVPRSKSITRRLLARFKQMEAAGEMHRCTGK